MMNKFPQIFKNNITLLIILFSAAFLRLWHIGWGLPELYEEATPLRIAWNFWNWGNPGLIFNPNFFNYPALTFYIQFLAQLIHFGIGSLLGYYSTLNDFGTTLTPLVYTARIVEVLFDISTIIVIYKFASEFFNKRTAVIAALVLTVNPLHIKFAHLIQVDTTLAFFSVLALYYIYKLYSKPESRWYYAAAIAIGLAASSKYTGAFLLFFLVITHMMRYENLKDALQSLTNRKLILTIFVAALIFIILNPFIIITPNAFQKDFSFEQQHMAAGHLGVPESQSTISYYFLDAIPSNFGWVFYIILLFTVGAILKQGKRSNVLLLVFPLIFLIFVSTWIMRAERYILPIFPMLALIGAIGTDHLISRFQNIIALKKYSSNSTFLFITNISFGAILLIQPTISSFNYLKSLGLPDTRAITKEWIRKNIQKNSVIATGPYGVEIRDGSYKIFDIPFLAFESERVTPFYDSRWYEDMDIVITSSYDHDRYTSEPQKYKDFLPYYESLKLNWELIFETHPNDEQTGPTFLIYRYPNSKQKEIFGNDLFQRFNASPESSRISNFLKDLTNILIAKGKYRKAEQTLLEILSVEYQNIPLRNQLGELFIKSEKYEDALNQLGISIKQNPAQPNVYLSASFALRALKKYSPAEVALYKAIEFKRDYEAAYLSLIELYKETKNNGKLLDALKRYYAIVPSNNKKSEEIQNQIKKLQKVR